MTAWPVAADATDDGEYMCMYCLSDQHGQCRDRACWCCCANEDIDDMEFLLAAIRRRLVYPAPIQDKALEER